MGWQHAESNGYLKGSGSGRRAEVDAFSRGVAAIDQLHHRIHQGQAFEASLVDQALSQDGTLEFLLAVPEGSEAHLVEHVSTEGTSRFQLFEDPTVTDAGDAESPVNLDRDSANESALTVTSSPTTSADGTPLRDYLLASSSNGNSGSSAQGRDEFNLAGGHAYLARLTVLATGTSAASLRLGWYEPYLDPTLDSDPEG